LDQICSNHFNECEQLRAQGAAPRAASGFTKRALKLRRLADPGDAVLNAQRIEAAKGQGTSSPEVAALLEQVQALAAQVATLTNTKKLREEADKNSAKLEEVEVALEGTAAAPVSKKK